MQVPIIWVLFNTSFNNITAPKIPVMGSRYKNSAVFVWPILGIAKSCKNKAIAYDKEGISNIPNAFHPILKFIEKNKLRKIRKKIVLVKFIKMLIWMGVRFFFAIVWLTTIIIDAPIEAIKANKTPMKSKFSNEGLRAKNNPKKVVMNRIIIEFLIFSLVIKIDVIKTIIG